jgi:hypothetical protein
MRRVAMVVVLMLAGSLWPAAHALASGSTTAQAAPAGSLQGDFNNDGADDLAVGVPDETVGTLLAAGVVNVLYGSAGGVTGTGSQLFTQVGGTVESVDRFGDALAAGDFNHDGFADLAVGAPGEDIGSAGDAGAVSVVYGSATGLTRTGGQLFTQVGGTAETDDLFGSALAAGDFNHDGFADLAVGAPGERVGSADGAGAVSVLYGSAGGLTRTGGRLFTQVGGTPEAFDAFGFALAAGDFNHDGFADLAASAPFEWIGSLLRAGAVSVVYGSAAGLTRTGAQLFTQVGGTVEAFDTFGFALTAGDFNNNGFADLAAGAPGEAIGSLESAGAVSVVYGSAGGLTRTGGRLFTQVGGTVEAFDGFGFALTAGDFNNNGFADLAATALGEAVGSIRDAGAVSVVYGSAAGLTRTGGRLFTQVGGTVEAEDLFGFALTAGDFNNNGFADLAASAPFEDVGSIRDAGAVSVVYGSAAGLTRTGGQLFTQNSSGVPGTAEAGDMFGRALAAGDPAPSTTSASPSRPGSSAQRTSS